MFWSNVGHIGKDQLLKVGIYLDFLPPVKISITGSAAEKNHI